MCKKILVLFLSTLVSVTTVQAQSINPEKDPQLYIYTGDARGEFQIAINEEIFDEQASAAVSDGFVEYSLELLRADSGEPVQLMTDFVTEERNILAALYPEGFSAEDSSLRLETLADGQFEIVKGTRPGLYTIRVEQGIAAAAARIDLTLPIAGACYQTISIYPQRPISAYTQLIYGVATYSSIGWWDDVWTLDCKGSVVKSISQASAATSVAFDPANVKAKSAAIAGMLKAMGFSATQISGLCVDQQCAKKGKKCYMDSLYSDDDNINLSVSSSAGGKKQYKATIADPSMAATAEVFAGCSCE